MQNDIIAAVRRVARDIVMPRFRNVQFRRKADGSLLSEADTLVQSALAVELKRIADVPLLGEEMSRQERLEAWAQGASGLWCVDPIDGTTNFVQGLPYFAISVAYLVDERSRFGVIYNPALDELFAAEAGAGASLNGAPLASRNVNLTLADALAAIEHKGLPSLLAQALAIHPPFYSQRSWGAGAIDWCYLAAGRFDAYLHGGQRLWDYAAGALIFEECGGRLSSIEGEFWSASPWTRSIIAARDPHVFEEWQRWVRFHAGVRPATISV